MKVKVVLIEVSLINFIVRIWSNGRSKWFTGSIIDELHSSDILGDQMEGESGVTWSIIDELHCSDIKRDQMAGERGAT